MSDTRVSLREYVESLLAHARGEIAHAREVALLHITSMERNVKTAAEALTIRLEGMNEIRAQLTTQAARLATKESVDELNRRVDELREFAATGTGRRQGHAPLTALAMIVVSAAVSGIVAALLLWLSG